LFDIYVGLVSGKEEVFKNEEYANERILTDKDVVERYVLLDTFPTKNKELNTYLLKHKESLINRKIRKFNETNWFEWGALRNMKAIEQNKNKKCIFVRCLTRKKIIAFTGKVQLFGSKLLCMIPKKSDINLENIVKKLNTLAFKQNYLYSGRFKIGQRQLSCATI